MTQQHNRRPPTAADTYWRDVKDAAHSDLLGVVALTLICSALPCLT